MVEAGIDVCSHGWRWAKHYQLDEAEERRDIARDRCAIAPVGGGRAAPPEDALYVICPPRSEATMIKKRESVLHPIIYVRGYAMTQSEIEDTVADPYMGFNIGSCKVRQVWDGTVKNRLERLASQL